MITDAHGTPLAITLTGGNRHDVKLACCVITYRRVKAFC